jgi:arylsulfatase A-like enzyme
MSWPRGLPSGARVAPLVESVDVFPTVCDLLGIELPVPRAELGPDAVYHAIDGVSLLPLVRGEVPRAKEFAFSESGTTLAVQDERWKLVVSREHLELEPGDPRWGEGRAPELFDLAADPGEHANVFAERPEEVARLVAELREWDARLPIPLEAVLRSHRDEEALLLDTLGYTDGIGGEEPEDDAPRTSGAAGLEEPR